MSGLTGFQDGYGTSGAFQATYTSLTQDVGQTQRLAPIRDTTSTSETPAPTVKGVYHALPSDPTLVQPGPNSPGGIALTMNVLRNFGDQVLSLMGALPTVEDNFPTDVKNQIGGLSEEQLAALGGGDPAKGKKMLEFAVLRPGLNYSPALKELANTIREKASQSSGSGPNQTLVEAQDLAIYGLAQGSFQKAVMQMGLTPQEEKQIYFAHEVPSAAATLSPKLQAFLQQAEASSTSQLQQQFGFPDNWLPTPDAASYQANIGKSLGKQIDSTLFTQLSNGQITKSQYNEMRTLLYTSEATPNAATLQPILDNLVQSTTKQLQSDYGFPDSFTPQVDGSDYKAILSGAFYANFNSQLNNQTPALTSDEKAQVKAALLSPAAFEALPTNLQDALNSAKGNATAYISKAYGVSTEWAPDPQALDTAAAKLSVGTNFKAAQGMLNQLNEWVSTSKQTLNQVNAAATAAGGAPPHSSQLLKSYIEVVSLALMAVQEAMYTASINDSKIANMFNAIQNDTKLAQLAKQLKQIKEVMAKEKKMASLGPLRAIFQWLITLILVMLLGPVGVALLINMVAQMAKQMKHGKSFGNAMENADAITALGQTCQDIGKAIGGPFGKAIGNLGQLGATLAVAVLCPFAFMVDTLIGNGSFLKSICKGLGMSDATADKVTQAIQMAVQMIAAVALLIFTGGASMELMAAQFAKTAAQRALDGINAIKSVGQAAMDIGTSVGESLSSITEITTSDVQSAFMTAYSRATQLAGVAADTGSEAAAASAQEASTALSTGTADAAAEGGAASADSTIASADEAAGQATEQTSQGILDDIQSWLESKIKSADESIDALSGGSETVTSLESQIREEEKMQEMLQAQLDAAAEEGTTPADEMLAMQKELKVIAEKLQKLKAELTGVKGAIQDAKEASDATMNTVSKVVTVVQVVPTAVQGLVTMHNNIIKAQIARLKGDMEAFQILVDQFVKQLTDIVNKLMDMVKSYAQDIKEVGQQDQDMFAQASQTLSSIFA